MAYLMQIRLGPVQSFIQQARRTRDFWFSSHILSALSREVATQILTEYTRNNVQQLIVPAPTDLQELQKSDFPISNVLLAVVDGEPQQIAHSCRTLINSFIENLWQQVAGYAIDDAARSVGRAQVMQFAEFAWAAVPYDQQRYKALRDQLDAVLAARKRTQTFQPISWEPVNHQAVRGKKSSINSDYDAVAVGEKAGEFLSGIDLIKRFAVLPDDTGADPETRSFPSTSHMAAQSFFGRIDQLIKKDKANEQKIKAAFERFIQDIGQPILRKERSNYANHPIFLNYDGSIFFAERLTETLDPRKDHQAEAESKELRGALKQFLSAVSDMGKPYPYYAILQADGDHMGNRLRAAETPAEHRELAQTLQTFAQGVQQIIESYQGALVYAGGDDVSALLPVHTVLACADDLRRSFAQHMQDHQKEHPLTLSVGIAVVHHLEPLTDALTLARETEKVAKRERNSLAIQVNKRGGAARTITGLWDDPNSETAFYTRLSTFVEYHVADRLPDGYAYELNHLLTRMDQRFAHAEEKAAWIAIRHLEALRMLEKKKTPRGQKVDDAVCMYIRQLVDAAEATARHNQPPPAQPYSLRQLVEELVIARTFAEARRIQEVLDPAVALEAV